MQTTSGFLDINGASLYYEEAGSGFPVVFVHAGIADHRMWDDQFPVVAEKYRAIRFDMRGYGQSKMVKGPYSLRDDLYKLLRHLGVEKAVLVGCSRGGATIIDFTLEHPEMVAGLVPVGSGLSGYENQGKPPKIWDDLEAAFNAGDLEKVNALEIQLWVVGLKRKPEQIDPAVYQKALEMNRIALQTPSDMGKPIELEPPAAAGLKEIQVPALVIYGDYDEPNIAKIASLLGYGIPNAKVICMTGTAHLPNMERPDEFNMVLSSFLDGVIG
jgi:pimeloyl-ACP methyl ester carboxylesterase